MSQLRSNNLSLVNYKSEKVNYLLPTDSEFSLDERDQDIEWNLKTQDGIITYPLPDGLPDSLALHKKLQKLMKTNIIYLNNRHFWTTLENRFINLRKVSH